MKTLRTRQIVELIEANPQTLRIWIETLPPFSERKSAPRRAKLYSAQEALFFIIARYLIKDVGIQVSAFSPFSSQVLNVLSKKTFGELANYSILINFATREVELLKVGKVSEKLQNYPVFYIPIELYVKKIYNYLTGDMNSPVNLEIPFPLQSMNGRD